MGGREKGHKVKWNHFKHLQKQTGYKLFNKSSLANNKVYIFNLPFHWTGSTLLRFKRCILQELLYEWNKDKFTKPSINRAAFHTLLTALKRRLSLLMQMRGLQLETRQKPELTTFFNAFSKIHDRIRLYFFPPLSLKGDTAANHSHILSFKFTNNWVHCQQLHSFFISVHVIPLDFRLLVHE